MRATRDSVIAMINGYYYGYPPCCVAQFINDSFNPETIQSAMSRMGCSRCGFVACYECGSNPCPVCGGRLTSFYGNGDTIPVPCDDCLAVGLHDA